MIGQKIRIYPTSEQKEQLERMFEFSRHAYNTMLKEWKREYSNYKDGTGESRPSSRKIRDWYKANKEDCYKDMSNMIIETVSEHLEDAYKRFFDKTSRYPQEKRENSKKAFSLNAKNDTICSISDNRVKINKHLRVKLSEQLKYKNPKVYTISCINDEYFLSISFEDDKVNNVERTRNICGIDLGLKTNIVLSDNLKKTKEYNQSKLKYDRYIKSISKITSRLSKKQKGSKSWKKLNSKLHSKHKNRFNRNNDFYNKTVLEICTLYDFIGIEDLKVKNLSKNKRLAKAWNRSTIGRFITKLENKANMFGKQIIKVDKFYPSSQLCSCCGNRQPMPLYQRTYICEKCNNIIDRDVNASINILNEAQRILRSNH